MFAMASLLRPCALCANGRLPSAVYYRLRVETCHPRAIARCARNRRLSSAISKTIRAGMWLLVGQRALWTQRIQATTRMIGSESAHSAQTVGDIPLHQMLYELAVSFLGWEQADAHAHSQGKCRTRLKHAAKASGPNGLRISRRRGARHEMASK